MNGKRIIITPITLLALLVIFGGWRQVRAAGRPGPPDDKTITRFVNEALAADPRIAPGDVAASTTDGIVTLAGQVGNLAEKHYADLEAKKIRGVRGVIDRIKVKQSHRHDEDIRLLICRRIISSAVMSSQNIGVQVKNGQVQLTGTVNSYIEKEEAAVLATEVRGVTAVDNQIAVAYRPDRPDDQIRQDILARLNLDVYLVDAPITVAVTDGVVTLDGLVSSPYQIDRAFIDAYTIRNVVDVKNELAVTWKGDRNRPGRPGRLSDTALSRTIRDQLALDLRIEQPWDIHVQTDNGHVQLTGSVGTYHQRFLAGQDVRNIVGVAWVSNDIQVKAVPRSDKALQADARFNIDTDYALFGDIIKVFVRNGTAMLTGTVQSYFQKTQAESDVARITGIVDVVDALDVNPHPKVSDAALKEQIRLRLTANWATWPVLDAITIEVRNNRVILTGQVHTWTQRREAGRIAVLTKGTLAVDNRLTVLGDDYDWAKWYGTRSDAFVYDPYVNEDLYLGTGRKSE